MDRRLVVAIGLAAFTLVPGMFGIGEAHAQSTTSSLSSAPPPLEKAAPATTAPLAASTVLDMRPPSFGPRIAGLTLVAGGGGLVLVGVVVIVLSNAGVALGGGSASDGVTFGHAGVGLGVAAAISGAIMLGTRPGKPREVESPHRSAAAYERKQTLLGDIASAKPQDPTTALPALRTPLSYGVTF